MVAHAPRVDNLTLVFSGQLLVAVIRDGESIDAAVEAEEARVGSTLHDLWALRGMALTDELTPGDVVCLEGSRIGFLLFEGWPYDYAVLPLSVQADSALQEGGHEFE